MLSFTKVYICHPYSDDPEGNVERVKYIVNAMVKSNEDLFALDKAKQEGLSSYQKLRIGLSDNSHHYVVTPVAAFLAFPKFMSEPTVSRDTAMQYCISLLSGCDELWVFGNKISSGMREEITYASSHGIKVVWKNLPY